MTLAQERFEDPDVGSAFDPAGPDRLVVLFGSRRGGVVAGQTPWGFVRSSEGAGVSRLFLRDHSQAWYTRGVLEFPSVDAVLDLILLLAEGHRETVLFGASMGGYGALLYARLLGLDAIVVNPQTFIGAEARDAVGDDRWATDLARVDTPYEDLRTIPSPAGTARVIYSAGDQLDVVHAESFGLAPGVELDPRKSAKHDLARELASTGELQRLIRTGSVRA